ncbi:hypothetical protein GYMLUDRAFT_1004808 [Collybiopsis luxurians FD-317 M1]|uniref:Uncharacterized protein n=1 Tax=Collybiopsis luxurians FD-317 M1 TaxID=944289 RepID=A0A0D0CA73_9AGAR|nr:hypothetical protein GYMLUDRAFT_1004808 [Collybiopsis luxurians FD-317 M1]
MSRIEQRITDGRAHTYIVRLSKRGDISSGAAVGLAMGGAALVIIIICLLIRIFAPREAPVAIRTDTNPPDVRAIPYTLRPAWPPQSTPSTSGGPAASQRQRVPVLGSVIPYTLRPAWPRNSTITPYNLRPEQNNQERTQYQNVNLKRYRLMLQPRMPRL